MNILTNKTITNIVNNKYLRFLATKMSSHKALLPVILLETTVISGRSYQAYKRGGVTEARERMIDETLTAIVWFGVIKVLNNAFAKLIACKGIFDKKGLPEINVDMGSDAIRDPLKNAISKRPEIKNKICTLKLTKILGAAAVGIYLSGIVLPKFYQNITKKILHKEKAEKQQQEQINTNTKVNINDFLQQISQKGKNTSFKGATFIHALENNPIYNLLTVDAGLFAGRAYSSRNNDERFEFLFRDFCSSFFYMFCTPVVFNFLSNIADKFRGKNTSLDPETTHCVTEKARKILGKQPMNIEKFKDIMLGNNRDLATHIIHQIDGETVDIERLKKIINSTVSDKKYAENIMKKAQQFIDTRPKGSSKVLLTVSEVINSIMGGEMNNPIFLKKAVHVATNGTSTNSKKFISFKDIDKIKTNIINYTESIIEYARKTGATEITDDILTQVKNRNMLGKVGYTVAGLCVSALFLSTIIPKIQYKLTEMRTGSKDFPGIRDIK